VDSRDHRLGGASWAALVVGANLSADSRKGRRRNGRAHPGTTILRAARKRRSESGTCGVIRVSMLVHSPHGQLRGRRGIVGDAGGARRLGTQTWSGEVRWAVGRRGSYAGATTRPAIRCGKVEAIASFVFLMVPVRKRSLPGGRRHRLADGSAREARRARFRFFGIRPEFCS
jgi:hypothetical protein